MLGGWPRAGTLGTLRIVLERESISNEFFEAASVEEVKLSDGTETTLRSMEPVRKKGGTQARTGKEGSIRAYTPTFSRSSQKT